MTHGISVPDLRSDGESLSNDRTSPSACSSTRSSNNSSSIWTGSLPNLTVQLSTHQHANEKTKNKTDPYATFAENLNHIEEQETISPIPIKVNITEFLFLIFQTYIEKKNIELIRKNLCEILSSE